jgi:signal transduction histidine kinase
VLQVIGNLVGNALKFTPAHGEIQIAASAIGDAVKISVSDTGPGIAAEQLPHVFDRYWRASGSTGTGLGLFISKGIVEAHGGRIWADSTVGAGTAFHFTVPSIIPITIKTR